MTQPDLDELVARARRERVAPGALAAVARSLRVPFVAAPIAAIVVPSTAAAGVAVKVGLSRLMLWGIGAGSAVAATGVVVATRLEAQSAPSAVSAAPPLAPVARPLEPQLAPKVPEIAPPALPAASVDRRAAKESPAAWGEAQLIERAHKALAAEPRRALLLAQEHRRRFPAGALAIERDVITLDALARSGQPDEARRRALAFEAQYPKSIHLPRVRALLTRLGRE